jgi:type I restriction enzyme S subunit
MEDKMANKSNVPAIRFKGFTDAWEQYKLSDLFEKGGSGGTPLSTNPDYYNGNIPFLGISDITNSNGLILETEKYITVKGLDNSAAWIVPSGSISLAMYASVGKLAILGVNAATSQAFYNMVFNSDSVRDFVYHRLYKANSDSEWDKLISTGTQSNLNAEKVKEFEISIPNNDLEISKIGSLFRTLDNLITLHQRKYEQLINIKKSLLEKMFPADGEDKPKIRFKGFTDAWEQRKLGDVLQTLPFKAYLKSPEQDGEFEIIQQGNAPIIGYANGEPCKDYEDTVIFGDHTLSLYKPKSPFFVATDGVRIVKGFDNMDGNYLLPLLERNKPQSEGYKRYYSILADIDVFFTENHEEQSKIGEYFSDIDNLITLHQRKLEMLKNIKKSLLEKMFV